jgi:uncharacterized protein (TIGR01440 family)
MELEEIAQELEESVEELIRRGNGKAGMVLVVGCSTSEILGNRIGTGGSLKLAHELFSVVRKVTKKHKIILAAQCCEHLNRALVVEEKAMEKFGWQQVTVRPVEHAGGAWATQAYEQMSHPVVVEEIKADLGLDIGQTLIGMHLKRVAVPVRLSRKMLGKAVLTAAYTRPPLIGGARAVYPDKKER